MKNIVFGILLTLAFIKIPLVYAASAPNLGTAASFSVLGALSASSANTTTLSGDLGLSPGLATSRTGPWIVGGSEYFGPFSLAGTAQTDATSAYNNLVGQASNGLWSGNTSLAPGVWTVASDITFTGTLTLNGDYDDVWVFQIGRDMTFSGTVLLTGNAQPCNVFWQIDRSATIAAGSAFKGTLIASTGSITLVSGATVDGRIIVLNVALTTDGNNISGPTCVAAPVPTLAPTSTPTSIPIPTQTPTPTSTPIPGLTSTPIPTQTPTSIPTLTPTPTLAPGEVLGLTSSSIQNLGLGGVYCPPLNDQITAPVITESKRIDADSIFIKWSPDSGADKFNVQYGFEKDKLIYNTDVTGFSTTLSDLRINQPIWVQVAARNDCQIGSFGELKLVGGGVRRIGIASVRFPDTGGSPKLPNTGFDPSNQNSLWRIIAYLSLSLVTLYLIRRLHLKFKNKVVVGILLLGLGLVIGSKSITAQESSSVLYVPLIGITSVPKPLALPKGPANVTYYYAVKNFLEELPLTGVQVVDDKCSPVKFMSGDDNNDSLLDYNETWRYSCTVKLWETSQSVATAIGTANNITATHKAYATVVVGSDNPPPLISIVNITKVAYPLSLPAKGGDITFTYKVNNPGTVPLGNVSVIDDKCKTISGRLGDTNGNSLLDTNEVWIYTCTTHLEQTTTNTATVTAFANGLRAVGNVTATVTVKIPDLPNAGPTPNLNPNFKATMWKILSLILLVLVVLNKTLKKQ